jgi:hypothetical protein
VFCGFFQHCNALASLVVDKFYAAIRESPQASVSPPSAFIQQQPLRLFGLFSYYTA